MFSDKTYDILKIITLHILPALATLIYALGAIWNWPWAESVVGTVSAITTCLATMLGISSHQYKKFELSGESEEGEEG